jgi:IclR family acetate operon transcriptional repressor
MNCENDVNRGKSGSERGIKTTKTVFGIIESINERNGATIPEIAGSVGRAKSTAHDHVKTLVNEGYLVEDEGTYYLGLKFLDHAHQAKNRPIASDLVEAPLNRVAEQTGEMAWAVVEEHGEAVYISSAAGENALNTGLGYVGRRTSLHYTASGKAILAYLSDERVEEILDEEGMTSVTEKTITDREELYDELDEIRERGVAFAEGEAVKGIQSVAVPIRSRGEVLGSLAVSGPERRFKGEWFRETLPEKLLDVANVIELEYSYS